MDKISRLVWSPEYSMKMDLLDSQNRKLFGLINHHIDLYEIGSGDYFRVIRYLVDHLSNQFHKEHMSMMIARYPGLLKHLREHQIFTVKMEEFLEDSLRGEKQLGHKMALFLTAWAADHVAVLDAHFGEYLLNHPEKREEIKKHNNDFEKQPFLYVVNG